MSERAILAAGESCETCGAFVLHAQTVRHSYWHEHLRQSVDETEVLGDFSYSDGQVETEAGNE